ncbi:MAG: hypothetical protein HYT75_02130, partial [Deltaproteobacteria bacterium]|nr:hypothetical protein [Deltaproteobacteria bacterium]
TKDKTYCVCEPGYIRNETGACVVGDTPCADGNILFEGACVLKTLVAPDCDAMSKATGKTFVLNEKTLKCVETVAPAGGGEGGCLAISGVAPNGVGVLLIIIPAALGYALRMRKRRF